ncbi:MAG: CPBP family intramembrane metalloprotease [Ruminococcaceae bacterium]|nr:CPBP family intramembrane metalloprotease [Oscillospiraceae bacterium]
MLRSLYNKSPLTFAIAWIVIYCVLMSVGDALSASLGIEKILSLPLALSMCLILFGFLKQNGLLTAYGFRRAGASARSMLYYLPVVVMLSANLWHGVGLQCGATETVLTVLTMLCVGFLEELIFRGLLLRAMMKDNKTAAVIVSSVTFGIGHIINLINGSGTALLPNLLQVMYATAAGFMFVMIVLKTDSLWVCIAAHGIFNALGVFANEAPSTAAQILSAVLLTVITGSYAAYLAIRRQPRD